MRLFGLFVLGAPLALVASLAAYLVSVAWPRLEWSFFVSMPSHDPAQAGILPAVLGSAWLVVLTAAMALPLGVAAGVYLEEYARPSRLSRLLEWNVTGLASVPSVVYGLFGLVLFVRTLSTGRSLFSGALTLTLLCLPMIVLVTREALRQVPQDYREAAYALGATRLEVIRYVVLPMGSRMILTGVVLAVGIALGEAAPLFVIGAFAFVNFAPSSMWSAISALPLQIFHWLVRPEPGFAPNAAAAMLVLLVPVLTLAAFAFLLRLRVERTRT